MIVIILMIVSDKNKICYAILTNKILFFSITSFTSKLKMRDLNVAKKQPGWPF